MEGSMLISAGTLITVLLGIVGFFIARVLNDVRQIKVDTGKNKGRIDLVAKQQENDIKRIEERTQLELCSLSKNVKNLTENVNDLVLILAENGVKK
jgi:hypothetical protein